MEKFNIERPVTLYGLPFSFETRFYGPTNTKGARVGAEVSWAGRTIRTVIGYDHGDSADRNHYAAALACFRKVIKEVECVTERDLENTTEVKLICTPRNSNGFVVVFI